MTGSTHANHCSARSPRPMPEGPARDNPITGPRTGRTQSEPSAPALAGASGRHNEPGSRPTSACPAQSTSKAGGASPPGGERHNGAGKADRRTESDQTRRGAAHHAGPQGTPERHAAGHNQGTLTGAKQQRPPGAANSESAHNIQRTMARGQVPSNTSRRRDGLVRARQRTQPLPATEQPPSGWTRARPEDTLPLLATNRHCPDGRVSTPQRHRRRNTQHNTPSEHTGEQEPSGPGHCTAHRASTPVNKSQGARDTAHATQHTERANW